MRVPAPSPRGLLVCGSPALALAFLIGAGPVSAQEADLPPPGLGSLRQDQVGVRLATATLQIRIVPLDERVIRLLAPDVYRSLRDMRQSRAADIAQAARASGYDSVATFMVTFFGLEPQSRFSPDQLYVSSQNVLYRPIGIVPFTPRWSENVLDPREQAAAIYLFEPGIPVLRPFTISYGTVSSDAWSESLRLLNTERARVLARAAQQPQR